MSDFSSDSYNALVSSLQNASQMNTHLGTTSAMVSSPKSGVYGKKSKSNYGAMGKMANSQNASFSYRY